MRSWDRTSDSFSLQLQETIQDPDGKPVAYAVSLMDGVETQEWRAEAPRHLLTVTGARKVRKVRVAQCLLEVLTGGGTFQGLSTTEAFVGGTY